MGLQNGAVPALDHVQVAAPPGCEPEARRFYGDLLGLVELEKPEALRGRGGVWFALAGAQLHVGVASPFAAATKAHPALRMASVAELRERADVLEAAGAPVTWDAVLPGVRRFFTADPFGNRLELLATGENRGSRPGREVGDVSRPPARRRGLKTGPQGARS